MPAIARDSLEDRVFGHLFGRLSAGDFPIGRHLNATRIAAELSVSRTTVRRALDRLRSDGWVRLTTTGRPVVARLPNGKPHASTVSFDFANQTESAYWSIYNRVLQGEFLPGDDADPQLFADSLAVSQGTVRQALDWLTRDGLLVRLPRRGWKFISLNWSEVRDTVHFRELLESEVLHRACGRISVAVLDRLDAETRNILDRIESLAEQERRHSDYRFHRTLAENSGSSILVDLLDPLIRRSMFVGATYPVQLRHPSRAFQEHLDILAALRQGDAEQAAKFLVEHVNRWVKTIEQLRDVAGAERSEIPAEAAPNEE